MTDLSGLFIAQPLADLLFAKALADRSTEVAVLLAVWAVLGGFVAFCFAGLRGRPIVPWISHGIFAGTGIASIIALADLVLYGP